MARNLKAGVDDELTLLGSGKDGSVAATVLRVVGVFRSGVPELDRELALIPLAQLRAVFDWREDLQVQAGVQGGFGPPAGEFEGFPVAGLPGESAPGRFAFIRAAFYFGEGATRFAGRALGLKRQARRSEPGPAMPKAGAGPLRPRPGSGRSPRQRAG